MRKIGGMFHYEPNTPIENGYFSRICSPGDDLAFTMFGRCGIYYCLQDIARYDTRKVAYVPMYTCGTVLAPFKKAGYQLKFYELDQNLHSIFDTAVIDEISVLSLCGYYGFCNYDHSFVKACKEKGVVIFEDVTHSMLQLTVSILSVIILPEASENGWGLPAGDLLLNETEPLKHLFCR